MAKIQAGILSNVRGAVAGVVGGTWKGKNYVRARVTPANPNTVAQQAQRGKMGSAVAFAKLILGGVLQPFVDPFQKYMSGFNWFIKKNIASFSDPTVWASIVVTEGTLFGLTDVVKDFDGPSIKLEWDGTALGPNGLATDKVTFIAVNKVTGVVFQVGTAVNRSTGTAQVNTGATVNLANYVVYTVVYRLVADKVTMVSNSQYVA